ncbi:hypothetical protein K0A96_01870, partial [Patescibacteria group bacterium]|nr:hypothetical protein [Patescibacteria group bacterium]
FAPDLVGFTAVTCEAQTVLKLATTVKELSAARVVVGGVHASCELCSSLLAESCTLTAATRLKIILSDTEREIIRKKQERSQIFIYK